MTRSLEENASINSPTKISANKANGQDLAKNIGHEDSNSTHIYLRNKQNKSTKTKD